MTSQRSTVYAMANGARWIPGQTVNVAMLLADTLQSHFVAFRPDGSRRVLERSSGVPTGNQSTRAQELLTRHPGAHIHYVRSPITFATDGVPSSPMWMGYGWAPATSPVNQIPYLFDAEHGAWLRRACTAAHHVAANHSPYAWMMGEEAHYNLLPGTPHTDDSNGRNRIALRYFRALIGYTFNKLARFERKNPELYQTQVDIDNENPRRWQSELPRLRELADAICTLCESNEHFVTEFVHHMGSVSVWDEAFDEVLTFPGTTAQYTRLPNIDKTNANAWAPASTSIIGVGGNELAFRNRSWWKLAIGDFRDALKRYYSDPRVRT